MFVAFFALLKAFCFLLHSLCHILSCFLLCICSLFIANLFFLCYMLSFLYCKFIFSVSLALAFYSVLSSFFYFFCIVVFCPAVPVCVCTFFSSYIHWLEQIFLSKSNHALSLESFSYKRSCKKRPVTNTLPINETMELKNTGVILRIRKEKKRGHLLSLECMNYETMISYI